MKILDKGITAPKGFKAAGIACGIKKTKKDLALIVSETPCATAAAFTTNIVKAAPVLYNQKLYTAKEDIRCIVITSGNANACTGAQGERNNEEIATNTAEQLGILPNQVMINSTGVIGVQLPMDNILSGIKDIVPIIDSDERSAENAAEAILTTDTFVKKICVEVEIDSQPVRIAAIGKGSGMIHPNMATMLSHITTDVNIDQDTFRELLSESIKDSYNMLSVDGDTSTNDTVIALANGMAHNELITKNHPQYNTFAEAFHYVNRTIAMLIAKDGEGATKLLRVQLSGAATKDDARKLALSVVKSSLLKAAMFGADANWGRVLCAMGYANAVFDQDKVVLSFKSDKGTIKVFENGSPYPFDEEKALAILKENEIFILIDLKDGVESAESFGCDLTYEYVKINGEYRS